MSSAIQLSATTIMTPRDRLVTLTPSMDVHDAIDLLLRNHLSGAPVVDEAGRLVGMFSERDCMSVIIESAFYDLPTNTVDAFMSREMYTIAPEVDLLTIVHIYKNSSYRRLPVVDADGMLLGQVCRADVLRACETLLKPADEKKGRFLFLSATRDRSEAPVEY